MASEDKTEVISVCARLERATQALTKAADEGDPELLEGVLDQREELISALTALDRLPLSSDEARAIQQKLAEILRLDEQNRQSILTQLASLRREISTLERGRQALRGYSSLNSPEEATFLDKRR